MGLKSRLANLSRSRAEVEAVELRAELNHDRDSCQEICDCTAGQLVSLVGTVRSVTIMPQDVAPTFEIELYDGSGAVAVIWLGRRTIPGIVAGRRLRVNGRMTMINGCKTIFNPRYTLKPLR
jgi:RecG-like helicase